jgi:hypothetical protein
MAEPTTVSPAIRPLTLILAVLVAGAAAALIPLIPDTLRPWNFAAFGAIGLFVAARGGRFGLPAALALGLGSKLVSDLLNYRQHGFDADYLPSLSIYATLAVYAVLGWGLLRRSKSPLRIGGVTVLGSLLFFLVTNFLSWAGKALPYADGPAGLVESYLMGLPFVRGTLLGDLIFCGVLFGLSAVLSRSWSPVGRPIPVPVERPDR